jgi:ribosomal protein S27AE
VIGNKRLRGTTEPRPLWQRVTAGERLPTRLLRHPKCEGTVEDHRGIALDVRELIRQGVFDRPVGSVFKLNLAYPWLRVMRLNSSSLDLQLGTGRIVVVPLVWASCGVMGERLRLECPLCGQRVCIIYHFDGRVACRRCNGLWYAAQRTSSYGRKAQAKRKIHRKLGDYGQLGAVKFPPKPRGMWRRTYARHCAALDRIEPTKLTPRRSNVR